MSEILREIKENEQALAANEYPGRGVIMGISESGRYAIQLYWLMGRSEGSRNRVFEHDGETVRTAPFVEAEGEDHSLTIYNAMRQVEGAHIVTNGHQTDSVAGYTSRFRDPALKLRAFRDCLDTWNYEPDMPNFTPRISGITIADRDKYNASFSIIRKIGDSEEVVRTTTSRSRERHADFFGQAACVHTYEENGDPIPSFSREPYLVGLVETAQENAEKYAEILAGDNFVSLVAKAIPLDGSSPEFHIINRNQK